MGTPSVLVLAGPTGVGKTQTAVALCRRLGGEIVGADSVQIYRGFDIGAAKPTPQELSGVRHHLIDTLEPDEPVDAARYAALADAAIAEIDGRGRVPIVVGGTGLWLRALLRGLLELPPVDAGLRAQLTEAWKTRGATAMHEQLAVLDPKSAQAIHPNDQLRVIRALEVHAQTGEPLGELRAQHALGLPRYRARVWALDLPRAHFADAIRRRAQAMWEVGWLEEVRQLNARFGARARALGAVGYRELVAHLETYPSDAAPPAAVAETLAAVVRATLGYAKRQRTWFRGEPYVDRWLEPMEAQREAAIAELGRFLGRSGTL